MKKQSKYKILIVLAMVLVLTGCKSKVMVGNNQDTIFSITDKDITVGAYYESLKDKYGLNELITIVDTELLNRTYKATDEEERFINDTIRKIETEYNNYYAQSGSFTSFYDYLYKQMNIKSIDQLKDILRTTYRKREETKKYARSLVKDTEINSYYKNKITGDMRASHILIAPESKQSDSEEDKEKANNKALDKAKQVIKELDNGAKFEDLVNKYSSDSKENGGDLGWFKQDKMEKSFEEATYKLKEGEYSKEPVQTRYGYHIILKTGQKEKPKLEDVKDTIIEKISEEKLQITPNIDAKAMIKLREDNNLEIKDKELAKEYKKMVNDINAK